MPATFTDIAKSRYVLLTTLEGRSTQTHADLDGAQR
jgi:hypothetical protein